MNPLCGCWSTDIQTLCNEDFNFYLFIYYLLIHLEKKTYCDKYATEG